MPDASTNALTENDPFSADAVQRWPALQSPLDITRKILVSLFRQADARALRHSREHRWITAVAVLSGTLAVLLAILQLGYPVHGKWMHVAEVFAAAAAILAVGFGLAASRHTRWLLERHKAERFRLLFFRFLLDPEVWVSALDEADLTSRLQSEANRIDNLTPADLHKWVKEQSTTTFNRSSATEVPPDVLKPLLNYYQSTRLQGQIDYFASAAHRNAKWDRPLRHLPAACFFGSVLAALGHFALDLAAHGEGLHELSTFLIVLAAALPVIGAAIRTLRLAQEFSRNTTRFQSAYLMLTRISERLDADNGAATVFNELWCAEQVLESEHREWLRLLAEAEWFG